MLIQLFTPDQRTRKEKERGIFDGETSLVDGATSSGNFHTRADQHEEYEKAVTEGHFNVLNKRIGKIDASLEDIIQY